jgi:hypothetical protein
VKISIRDKQNRMQHVKTKDELEKEAKEKYSFAPSCDLLYPGNLLVIDDWNAPRHLMVSFFGICRYQEGYCKYLAKLFYKNRNLRSFLLRVKRKVGGDCID